MKKPQNHSESDSIFQKIVPHILLNSSFISNLGLFHGKIGIVLFFAHYSRYSGDPLYDEFAGKLLDEVYEEIHIDLPVDFENGLCGIGWGIEYLVQNNFMEGDTDEILEDIDRRIMERDLRRITDISFQKGLGGITYYAMARLTAKRKENQSAFDPTYLQDLQQTLNRSDIGKDDENPLNLIQDFQKCLLGEKYILKFPGFLLKNLPEKYDKILELPLGIFEGLSGSGLKQMEI